MERPHEAVVVLTTVADVPGAGTLARELVRRRVCGCVNVIPGLTSIYSWKGEIETDSEVLLLIKTERNRLEELQTAIDMLHPYEVPEFVVIPVERLSEKYAAWLSAVTAPDADKR